MVHAVSFDGGVIGLKNPPFFRAESLLILVHLSNYACICKGIYFLSGLKLGSEADGQGFPFVCPLCLALS